MNQNTHSWCWGFCLSFATLFLWVIMPMVSSVSPVSEAQAASGPPKRGVLLTNVDSIAYSKQYQQRIGALASQVGLDMMDVAGVLGGLDLGIDPEDLPAHGDYREGDWNGIPILTRFASAYDTLPEMYELLRRAHKDEEADKIRDLMDSGIMLVQASGLMMNLKTGEDTGFGLGLWCYPNESPGSLELTPILDGIHYPEDRWFPDTPGTPGPFQMFSDYFELVDAVSNDEGFERWMDRLRESAEPGPGDGLCAWCPSPSTASFCPSQYIFKQVGGEWKINRGTCLGRGFYDFKKNLWDAKRDYILCLGALEGIGGVGAGLCFWFSAPPAIIACLAGVGIYAGGVVWFCGDGFDSDREDAFAMLADAFHRQMHATCSVPRQDCDGAL